MSANLIQRATELIQEQTAAFRRLDAACAQLAAALVRDAPELIESLTRTGESELLKMRSRLVQIMSTLSAFAEARAQSSEAAPLGAEQRAAFEQASCELIEAATAFQTTQQRAAALALNGATFAAACIEHCGIPPTTYRAPYARRGEGRPWA
jgi:hypothetical protein